MIKRVLLSITALALLSCSEKKEDINPETYKNEVAKAEKDFEKMVAEEGIAEGFYHYAAENAVIKREQDTLIIGKSNIREYYSAARYKTATVSWTPDFIEVSEKGDLAYTYGKYTWATKDSSGKPATSKGVFHTVWKRQADGSWKYVWD